MSAGDTVGLIAGNGQFPLLFAEAARMKGMRVVAVGMEGETKPEIRDRVDECRFVKVGQLRKMIRFFNHHSVTQAAMAGGVRKTRLFGGARPDFMTLKLLARNTLRKDDGMLRAVAREFEAHGIEIIDSTLYMPECLAPAGLLAGPAPSQAAVQDLAYGLDVARQIGELDIGQTVVVKNGAVVALEAIEGTDACILRAGELTQHTGAAVIKVAKPTQDMRFDVPAIGMGTLRTLETAGISLMGIEAHRTLLLEPQRLLESACDSGITIMGLT